MRFQCSQCQCILDIDAQPGELVACGQCSSAVTVPPTPTSPGAILGDFAIVREIGVGGMGTVYLARQISLDRDVALKVLLPTFAEDVAFIQSFINEARAAASVNHPHIVQAYAVNSDQGLYYFAMEFVDGPTLKELLDQHGALPVDKVIDIANDIASALDYAWQGKKIIHRDIKP
ncbi:MAG: serine/threonine protein kinase, partial [Lentisphaerae bacterium]|nr:serine/threonine protein kinase [Lentisphaerota bacterium]